jgi:signal transduction histidine kinase
MKPLLSKLRIRLVLLYLVVGMILALAIGGGTYGLVNYYLRQINDEALKQKMGLQFASLQLPMPLDLYVALVNGDLIKAGDNPSAVISNNPEYYFESTTLEDDPSERVEVNELADIEVIPLTIEGTPIQGAVVTNSWLPIDKDAIASAIVNNYDFRTIKLVDGTPVRLLTYRIPITNGIGLIQVARSLKAQQQMLNELLNGMIIVGSISIFLLGLAAWISAGRSIKPMQLAWEKQQTFVANASHELRTPLTLIHAGVEVAQRSAVSDGQKQVLDDVLTDANYMTKLIENLLLLSRLDAHRLPLDLQPLYLPTLIEDTVRHSQRAADKSNVTISFEAEPIHVLADETRLKQVLLILVDNAVRNNHPGGWVKIHAKIGKDKAIIEVSDNGAGIPAEHIGKVFDRFYKVNDRSTSDYRGSGLGLSIAHGLVEAHGGEIEMVSQLKEGTTVTFTIPTVKTAEINEKNTLQ